MLRVGKIEFELFSFEAVTREARPRIYYSSRTVWWTHRSSDLKEGPVPLDVFGAPLFETDRVGRFLDKLAICNAPAYGMIGNRLRNFMLGHAQNIEHVCKGMPSKSFDLITHETFYAWCDKNVKNLEG